MADPNLADLLEPPEDSAVTTLRGKRPSKPIRWMVPAAVSVGLFAVAAAVAWVLV
jgi:hypothetical protein